MSEEAGSSKTMLIAGLVLGLGIGGGLVFALFGNKAETSGVEGSTEQSSSQSTKLPKNLYDVSFERVAVPIYDNNGARPQFLGNYFIDVIIQTASESNQLKIRAAEPQLRHAFVDEISRANFMRDDNSLQLDNDKIRKAFLSRSSEVVGGNVVYSISVVRTVRLGT